MGPIPRDRGWLPSAPATEHDIAVPEKHRTPAEIIALEGDEERKHSNQERKRLFSEAGKQARTLFALAANAWNEAANGRQTRAEKALVARAVKLGLSSGANHLASVSGAK
jgi:hypothetical protein